MSTFLHAMSWLTLAILPVLVLLYVQVMFVPYHDVSITWAHRLALMFDIALLVLIGVFLIRSERSFFDAFWKMTRAHPFSFAVTSAVLIMVATFSFFVATIPDEWLDVRRTSAGGGRTAFQSERSAYGFALPFLGPRADGSLFGLFERNLNVTDLDLVVDKDVTVGEPSLVLRGRDLRYARLDRTDLHQADLTGADLEGASLVGADLRGALIQCADLNELILSEDRQAAKCPNARRANLTRAKLKDAKMAGIDLRGARLEDADLENAELAYSNLTGASFYGAHLERADLTGGVPLYGANFATASMQGADLTGARLHGADFTSAGMQGAVLAHASLLGAILRDVDLEGADLYKAKLFGADMKGARLRAATLREASLWLTAPPAKEAAELVDLADVTAKPPEDMADLQAILKQIENERVRSSVGDALKPLLSADAARGWQTSSDPQVWSEMIKAAAPPSTEVFKARLTDHLLKLACKPRWANGSVATGIAKRAQGIEFKGDLGVLYDRLRADDCPASKTMGRRALRNLGTAVDVQRGN